MLPDSGLQTYILYTLIGEPLKRQAFITGINLISEARFRGADPLTPVKTVTNSQTLKW